MKDRLVKLLQVGENRCEVSSRPSVFCSGLLLFALAVCFMGAVGGMFEDCACVPENKKTRFKALSVLISTFSFSVYYFVWYRYIGDCNCAFGFAVSLSLISIAAYIPMRVRESMQYRSRIADSIKREL